MTDTNHIEVLHGFVEAAARDHNALSHDYVKDEKKCPRCKSLEQARAAITALSARASAGEGGEWVLVPREPTPEMGMAAGKAVHPATYWQTAYRAMIAAAPRPAQAGASGGEFVLPAGWCTLAVGDGSGRLFVHGPYDAIKAAQAQILSKPPVLATPASPATGDAATWEEEIRRHDATPPAHGDGEEDYAAKWFAECRRVLEDVSTEMRATGRGDTRFRRLIESMPRQRTTRPIPEARTGTVADIPDADLICRAVRQLAPRARRQPAWARIADVFALGSTYATQLCRRFGVDPETGKKVAALALPAQGEGK